MSTIRPSGKTLYIYSSEFRLFGSKKRVMTDTAGQCGLNIDDRASGFGVNIKGTDILLSALIE